MPRKSKQRLPSCLFCCFRTDQSLIAHGVGRSEAPSATAVASDDGRKDRVTCFSWFLFRRKKGPRKPLDTMPNPTPTFQARLRNEAKIKVNRCQSPPPQQLGSVTVDGHVNTGFPYSVHPHLSSNYQLQNQTELPSITPKPVRNRRRHGQFELERAAAVPAQANIQDRMKRGKMLVPKAGLTVIGVTLAVTVFYGRTAAVVSLCACLYLLAFLQQPGISGEVQEKFSTTCDVKVGSKERKKRVVMEGFLERSRIKPAGAGSALER